MFVFTHTPSKIADGSIQVLSNIVAHLVTSDPVASNTLMSQITTAQGGNYAPQYLSNIQLFSGANGLTIINADNPIWSLLLPDPVLPIRGVVIANGDSGTALPISYLKFVKNSVDDPFTPSGIDFPIIFPTTGFLRIKL